MNTRKVTIVVMLVCIVGLILWDMYAAAFGGTGATISEITLGTALRHPVIPFGVGVIIGHLFWPQKKVE